MRCLLFVVVSAFVVSMDAQFVFYPSFARIHSAMMGLPGFGFSNEDDTHHSLENVPYGDAQGRGNSYAAGEATSEGRQGDELLGTVGGEVNVNAVPNPFLGFRKETYPQRTKTIVVPPVCVACKCLLGFKSCADAGGRQWVNGECSSAPKLDQKAGAECSFPAPTTLSACDSTCVRTCLAKADNMAPAITDCTPIDAVNKNQCTTPCENLARGSIVKCNSAYPEVLSNIPSPCYSHHHHYKRDASNSAPELQVHSQIPEIESSHESSSDRSGRLIKLNLNPFPLNPRVNVNPVTNFVRGHVTATYVAADGICLPGDLVSAPLCP